MIADVGQETLKNDVTFACLPLLESTISYVVKIVVPKMCAPVGNCGLINRKTSENGNPTQLSLA